MLGEQDYDVLLPVRLVKDDERNYIEIGSLDNFNNISY